MNNQPVSNETISLTPVLTAETYLRSVNSKVQTIFDESVNANREALNIGMNISSSVQLWLREIPDDKYVLLLRNSIQALEMSLLSQTYSLYRNAFSSLRLSMEMFFGGIYFSTALLEFIEWTNSDRDLNWSNINNWDNGVLSARYYRAFFTELKDDCGGFFTKANSLYRDLSEYVHGNSQTWLYNTAPLELNSDEIHFYKECLRRYHEITIFLLSLRYLKSFSVQQLEAVMGTVVETIGHLPSIQTYLSKTN